MTIPDDLGGLHGLALRAADDDSLARRLLRHRNQHRRHVTASGPAGTPVTIHLKGVGWTEYDNIYVATYDNAYMGYACGFNSQGDVVINFTATGAPGIHLIDLVSRDLSGTADRGAAALSAAAAHLRRRSPGQQDSRAQFTFEVTPSQDRSPSRLTLVNPVSGGLLSETH